MTALLEVDDLSVTFRRRVGALGLRHREMRAVDGVSFDIQPGETFGLVGESGSGKSTTGRVVLGLLGATSGEARFEGRPIAEQGTSRGDKAFHAGVQAVFQDPLASLNPTMKLLDAIAEPLRWLTSMSARERSHRASELLEMVGLDPTLGDRYPHQISGGQRQRVAIARAIAPRPRLVVCDEAVSALDVSTQAQIINLLQDLQDQLGMAYLFIAHDLDVVRHISDRIGVLCRGVMVEQGDADQVYDAPKHAYTRELLASVPNPDPHAGRQRKRKEALS
ncbi:ATP-binding cassette domain-containing protein [Nocardioides daejeonensis]|uniref:ATP-binding cassette domain-containing protein n=1 Tax=Nocardioides daejeonensis TaxID=1046556 RepID=UPI000D749CE2|nr:ATP-binding cassette domain-containing protein [Nocardioides daejeonensis]